MALWLCLGSAAGSADRAWWFPSRRLLPPAPTGDKVQLRLPAAHTPTLLALFGLRLSFSAPSDYYSCYLRVKSA